MSSLILIFFLLSGAFAIYIWIDSYIFVSDFDAID